MTAKIVERKVADVGSIDSNLAAVWVVETVDEVDDGAFAGTGFANKTNHFTGLNFKVEIFDGFFALFITKTHVVKRNMASHGTGWFCSGGLGSFFFGQIEDEKEAFGGGEGMGKPVENLSKPLEWSIK